jgi:hypothetical protein
MCTIIVLSLKREYALFIWSVLSKLGVGPIPGDDSYLKEPKTLNEAARHFGVNLRRVEELLCAPFYHFGKQQFFGAVAEDMLN